MVTIKNERCHGVTSVVEKKWIHNALFTSLKKQTRPKINNNYFFVLSKANITFLTRVVSIKYIL